MHRRTLLKASAAALAGTLAAPAIAQGNAKVLRCAPEANLASIDPIWTTATVAINHGYMVYDTLYGTDLSLTPRPQMVAGHTVSDDKRTWTFTLRDGLVFHDGEPVRSTDCIASIDRWSKRAAWGQALGAVTDEMKALDDKRFVIHLKKPFSSIAVRARRGRMLRHAGTRRQDRSVQADHRLQRVPVRSSSSRTTGSPARVPSG